MTEQPLCLFIEEGGLTSGGQQSLPLSISRLDSVVVSGVSEFRKGDHGEVVVHMAHREPSETGHETMGGTLGQLTRIREGWLPADLLVMVVGLYTPDHVGGVDVLESHGHVSLFAVGRDLFLEE